MIINCKSFLPQTGLLAPPSPHIFISFSVYMKMLAWAFSQFLSYTQLVLSNIVKHILYIKHWILFNFTAESLYSVSKIPLFSQTSAPRNHYFTFCFYECDLYFLDLSVKVLINICISLLYYFIRRVLSKNINAMNGRIETSLW